MSSPSDLAEVPGFRAPPPGEEPTGEEQESPESISSSPPPPPTTDRPSPSPASSSPASTELANTLGALIASGARVLSMLPNRAIARRRRLETDLWLMTEEEAIAIGTPLGRIAARKAPAELIDGDGSDVVEAGAALITYAAHNAAGMSAADLERLQRGGPPPQAAPPPPEPSREPEPAPAPSPQGRVDGVARAEGPPSGIPPVL